ncbi:TPA: hypothetical protein N0F65_003895, partial [Lagenidium giganteum]
SRTAGFSRGKKAMEKIGLGNRPRHNWPSSNGHALRFARNDRLHVLKIPLRQSRSSMRRSGTVAVWLIALLHASRAWADDGEHTDWYISNLHELLLVFGCSVTSFIVVFVIIAVCLRLQLSVLPTTSPSAASCADTPELMLIKRHTRCVRLLSLVFMALQGHLLSYIVNIADDERAHHAYAFSLFRPVSNLCVAFLGFMTNTHAAFRLLYIALLCEIVAMDTIAEVRLTMMANCLQLQGLHCGDTPVSSFGLQELRSLQLRDLFALFFGPWLMLEVGYLCVTIGFCSSRYSSRKLSLSRPPFNVRAALALYFPAAAVAAMDRVTGAVMAENKKTGLSVPSATPVASKKRRTFHISLAGSECKEINFQALVRARGDNKAPNAASTTKAPSMERAPPDSALFASAGPHVAPRTQRYNIIERLEKRYGGGAVVDVSDRDPAMVDDDNGERGDDDDLYDSDDSFIDDEELQQNIEEVHGQTKVQTKHSGFFVNAGDEIETVEKDESDDLEEAPAAPVKKPKKTKRSGGESSRAVKTFLEEWGDAASEWQPAPEVQASMEALRKAVHELSETTPITKVFPRKLDDALRAVDMLVVDSHPNKWRVNGYFATLMTFLPFTKQYLKSNMLRLEARDVARGARDDLERSITEMANEVTTYARQLEGGGDRDAIKEAIQNDRQFATLLHSAMNQSDVWVAKENDYRQMLKTEDKKHMKKEDVIPLNPRQERNRILNRVLGLFPIGLMDLQTLRSINKSAKAKPSKKNATKAQASPKAAPAPKRKAVTPSPSPASTKKLMRPFKSRVVDEQPPFSENDFEETVIID